MGSKANSKSRAAKWRVYAVNVLVFVIIVAGIRIWQQRDIVSGAAPALQGVTLAGQPYAAGTPRQARAGALLGDLVPDLPRRTGIHRRHRA